MGCRWRIGPLFPGSLLQSLSSDKRPPGLSASTAPLSALISHKWLPCEEAPCDEHGSHAEVGLFSSCGWQEMVEGWGGRGPSHVPLLNGTLPRLMEGATFDRCMGGEGGVDEVKGRRASQTRLSCEGLL